MTKQEVYAIVGLGCLAFYENKSDTYEEMNQDVLGEYQEYLNIFGDDIENSVDFLDNDKHSEEALKLVLKFIKNSHKLLEE